MSPKEFFIEKPKIEGITESIISDLFDITNKFGMIDIEDNIIRFYSGNIGIGYELYISTSTDGNRMIITKSRSKIPFQGLEFISTIIGDIFWDKSLTTEECKLAIKKIYELGQKGTIEYSKPGKYIVNDIFSDQGTAFMIPPSEDPQNFINHFDEPEKLIITKNPIGTMVIQHKDHLPYIKKREEIVRQICIERGIDIDDENDIGKLSFDDVLEMREEIKRRMSEY